MADEPGFEFDLAIDRQAYQSRGTATMLEEDIKMLSQYSNRLGINSLTLASGKPRPGEKQVTNLSFLFLALPHPECSFDWIRLIVNLQSFPDARIEDFIPKNEKGDQPVKYNVSNEAGIKFEATSVKLGPSYERKENEEHNVYFEKILSGGIGSAQANWDFYQQPYTKLHLQNLIKIKLAHAVTEQNASPAFSVEAKLRIKGWKGHIPLLGSKVVTIQQEKP